MLDTRQNSSEPLLVKRLQAGDEEAFRLLVQQYHAAMVRLAVHIVHEIPVAEDVVQETWIAVLKAVRFFEQRSSLKTWLYSIVINRAKSHLKREQRHTYRASMSLDEKEGDVAEYVTSRTAAYPESIADLHAFQQDILAAIDLLPDNQQTIMRLRHLDGLSADEVTQTLGISGVNQRVLLHRARKQMRMKLLSDYSSEVAGRVARSAAYR